LIKAHHHNSVKNESPKPARLKTLFNRAFFRQRQKPKSMPSASRFFEKKLRKKLEIALRAGKYEKNSRAPLDGLHNDNPSEPFNGRHPLYFIAAAEKNPRLLFWAPRTAQFAASVRHWIPDKNTRE
jgi:hypothetical protein